MSDQESSGRWSESHEHRVLFVGKYALEDSAGNAVAIRRLEAAFVARGAGVRYVQSTHSAGEAAFALFGFTPTVVHALHAGESARLGGELARAFGVPLVVTVTGTDLNGPAAEAEAARQNLRAADAVVALTERQVEQLAAIVPAQRVVRIPQAVELPEAPGDEPFELREALAHVGGPELAARRLLLLAGGLRPVKGQLFALEAFERAGAAQGGAQEGTQGGALDDWLLVLAGPVLDADYAAVVRERARALGGAVYIGEIPHESMASAMAACDALLNASESEGEPQILLEAQCSRLPVIARRVVGNTALVEDGVTGWLFDDYSDLESILRELSAHPEQLQEVAARAFEVRRDRLDVGAEAEAHLDLYRSLSTRP
ncbi:D-inositol-3-phosphate glycosyltransferase [Planctomycetes bacterium Poly30]|uniref:D-inositol-3-phosphate glycosyltransferase n=1 Tax=Saltatorellus ferox TaxID=2528018 RepID=A0A518EZH4_9BACT|nr:D-inositol-3-phosphate glycosyltransferase [Planctomycetes bacterium Poly30]